MKRKLVLLIVALAASNLSTSSGSIVTERPVIGGDGAAIGTRGGVYNYSPSVMQSGDILQFWWCGQARNPDKPGQNTDAILYATQNLHSGASSGPFTVLAETPHAWDSAYTCNAKIVKGAFKNPLGDGATYTYAMYYVATAEPSGNGNSIGVAFSNDGVKWHKFPDPVIRSKSKSGYGVGQPVACNGDGASKIYLLYEDGPPTRHYLVSSSDGIHFANPQTLTMNGMAPTNPDPNWGDAAYDYQTGYWYALFNDISRPPYTTENFVERGQYGIQLYRIERGSLISGAHPWQRLADIDTNATGYESNFIASFLRDPYGNINTGPYPTIRIYSSIADHPSSGSGAKPGDLSLWSIGAISWSPSQPLLSLNRYYNGAVHEVTTGWVNPGDNFHLESKLGLLYEGPQQEATKALYGCKQGTRDYFVSADSGCEGHKVLGVNGWLYPSPVQGQKLVALYRCSTGSDHFVSSAPNCEGQHAEGLLGYAVAADAPPPASSSAPPASRATDANSDAPACFKPQS